MAHYIVEHCTERISLEDLAGRFYINKFYLSRIFKEVTSFTINDYLNVNRIKKPTGSFWKQMTASLPLRNSWAMKILLILNVCLKIPEYDTVKIPELLSVGDGVTYESAAV